MSIISQLPTCPGCGHAPDIKATFELIEETITEIKNFDVAIRDLVNQRSGESTQDQRKLNESAIADNAVSKIEKEDYLAYLIHKALPREIEHAYGIKVVVSAD